MERIVYMAQLYAEMEGFCIIGEKAEKTAMEREKTMVAAANDSAARNGGEGMLRLSWEDIQQLGEREWDGDEQETDCKFRRMESLAHVGQMTASIVHDIKNDLGAMAAMAKYLEEHTDEEGRPIAGMLALAAERSLQRAAEVLGGTHVSRSVPGPVWIRELVERTALAVAHSLPACICLKVGEVSETTVAYGDIHGMMGVLINIIYNARDAMPEGGRVEICVRDDPSQAYIAIWISDSGMGMDAKTLRRAFRPYFTTKATGTGLGLDNCRRLVRDMGGRMEVWTAPGEGTRVCVSFRRAPKV